MSKVYFSGVYLNEKHVEEAWARIRAGVKVEFAASSALPSSQRINSTTRAAYQTSLITLLSLKRQLFTLACHEAKNGGDWRRVFRGRRRILWPNAGERKALGLSDYTDHEIVILEPRRRRPLKVRMMIDHSNRKIMQATVLDLNGQAK